MSASEQSTLCTALVVGAGPVGLTMALELARHGVPCRIIETAPLPNDKSKALVLWGRTLELLDQSGSVAGDFMPHGVPGRAVSIYGNGRRLVHMKFEREDTVFAQPLMIPQCETERLLAARLAARGIQVERSVELTDFVDQGDAVLATLRHADGETEQVQCTWLLGCDGAHSLVRKRLGIEFTGQFDPNDWILADVNIDGPLPQDELSIHWHAAGIVALFPIGRDRFRVVADQGHAGSSAKPADPTLADVQAVLDARGLSHLRVRDPRWLAGFRIHERKVAQYGAGRVFLAGDAAHIHSPAGGQGMNTGMQDAFNLAWKLALVERGCGVEDRLLDSYTQERSAVGDLVLRSATNLTRVATLRNPLLQCIRNHAFSLVGSLSAVQHRAIASLSEMAICYPHSPLSADDAGKAFSGDVHSGDRLPDAEVLEIGDAQPQRLLATLRGTSHYMLMLPTSDDPAHIAELLDSGHNICQRYGKAVQALLVLPEGTKGAAAAAAICSTAKTGTLGDVKVICDVSGQIRRRLGLRREALLLCARRLHWLPGPCWLVAKTRRASGELPCANCGAECYALILRQMESSETANRVNSR